MFKAKTPKAPPPPPNAPTRADAMTDTLNNRSIGEGGMLSFINTRGGASGLTSGKAKTKRSLLGGS